MLFTGSTQLSIDAKGRLAIPARYRTMMDEDRDGSAWYCVPWPGPGGQRTLRLYTERQFETLAGAWSDELIPDPDEAELQARFFSQAERIEPDANGRVRIPPRHLSLTKLAGEVTLVGAKNRLEVRDRASWNDEDEAAFADLQALASRGLRKRAPE